MKDSTSQREERRLKRVASWKEAVHGELSEETIQTFEKYFTGGEEYGTSRSRSGSIDSCGSSYEDVYEIKDENALSFSDEEMDQSTRTSVFQDNLSYHPYVNDNPFRGGGVPLIYSITAVIHHLGSGLGGHYVCYRRIRREKEDKWYLMNDQIVKEVNWSDVNTNNIYMVQYELEQDNYHCFRTNRILRKNNYLEQSL